MSQLFSVQDTLPNFLSEGVRYNARRISRRWAVLGRTAHWRDNSLAEVDDLLSQEIKGQDHTPTLPTDDT